MILLVAAGDTADAVERAVADAEVVAAGPAAAREKLASATPDATVYDAGDADAEALFRAVRAGEVGDASTPTVLLFDASPPGDLPTRPYDEVLVRPVRDADLGAAVQRAAAVGAYHRAVTRLYERSRDRASGGGDPFELPGDLRDARAAADERLEPLMDRPDAVASLLAADDEPETED